MLHDFLLSEPGTIVISVLLGVGVGLTLITEARSSWAGGVIVSAVYFLIGSALLPMGLLAALGYVAAVALTAWISTVARYADSPLIAGEPLWRKLTVTAMHAGRVRDAALLSRTTDRMGEAAL